MKKYKYTGRLDKLIYQNKGEIIDFVEGCLLDNLLIETKRGYMALIDTYVNCWTSCYTLYFSRDFNRVQTVFDEIKGVEYE